MAHTGSDWGGRRAQAWSRAVLDTFGTVCWLKLPGCTGLATTADHVISRRDRPDLKYLVANGRPACKPCNSRRQATPVHKLSTLRGVPAATIDASAFFDAD